MPGELRRPTVDQIVAELHARALANRREQTRGGDREETATTAASAEHAALELERLAYWASGGDYHSSNAPNA